MKTLLVLLVLGLAVVAVPAPAEAHVATCYAGDVGCILTCMQDHVAQPLPPRHNCHLFL